MFRISTLIQNLPKARVLPKSATPVSPRSIFRYFSTKTRTPSSLIPSCPTSFAHHRVFFASGPLQVHFITSENEKVSVHAKEGESILDCAHENDIELEGACEGSLACSTCHVILDPKYYEKLPEPSDEENDMLDLAFGLTETSRLGCQVVMNKELDGITVRIPSATRNIAVDGYKPKPH